MKAKYARKICAILFLVLAWEAAALIARAASQYAAMSCPALPPSGAARRPTTWMRSSFSDKTP